MFAVALLVTAPLTPPPQDQLEDVKAIMASNVEALLDRGEKLEELEDKANELSGASHVFRKTARAIRRFHLWQQVKYGATIGTIVTAAVAVPIVILVAA